MYISVSIAVYEAIQCWTFRRICIWSPWQVYAHFTYIAGRNNSDTVLWCNKIWCLISLLTTFMYIIWQLDVKQMYISVSIAVYEAIQCWTIRRICIWSPWQVYAHFTYIAGRNNSDNILSVITVLWCNKIWCSISLLTTFMYIIWQLDVKHWHMTRNMLLI
jgi:hypothetical protein